jgi:uncharacterized protein YndB with AHSA1/START domain
MARKQFTLEFMIRSAPSILYNFITTPSGLAQWFSDTCDIENNKVYIFGWDGSEERAELIDFEENEFARFKWENSADEEYLEFKITKSEVSNDTVLLISDYAEDYDLEDQQFLWESQIKQLRQQIGA